MTYQELINKLSTLLADELTKPAFAYAGDNKTGFLFKDGLLEPLYKLNFVDGKLRLKDNNPKDGE